MQLCIIISRDGVDDADALYVVDDDDVVDVVFVDVACEAVDDDGVGLQHRMERRCPINPPTSSAFSATLSYADVLTNMRRRRRRRRSRTSSSLSLSLRWCPYHQYFFFKII